jgi:hypothetical protein
MRPFFFISIAACLLASCSALSGTDPDDLPEPRRDSGGIRLDAGPRDTGPTDRDTGPLDPDTGPPVCDPACDDEIDCTIDQCVDGECQFSPDSARCADGMLCDPPEGCVVRHCENDDECDDLQACNGRERCEDAAPGNGCVPGDAPDCDDLIDCTVDTCVDPKGCENHVDPTFCGGDACMPMVCVTEGGRERGCQPVDPPECFDGNPCTTDSCDPAMGCVTAPRDADGDDHPAAMAMGAMCTGDDCNDGNPSIHPGAVEICGNGIDEDCEAGDLICPGRRGETCASAIPIELGPTFTFTATGDSTPFDHDYNLCSPSMAPDVVYRLDLPMARDVIVDTSGSAFDTVLSVLDSCDAAGSTPAEIVCDDDLRQNIGGATSDLDSRVFLRNVPAGTTLYFVIDGYNTGDDGTYRINVSVSSPLISTCRALAGSTGFDISSGGTVWGRIGARNDQSGSCGGATTNEELLVLRTGPGDSRDARLVANLRGTVTSWVRRGMDCGSLIEEACESDAGGTVTVDLPDISGGTHWAFIDGAAGGAYTVDYNPPR